MSILADKIKHLFKFDKSLVIVLFIALPLCIIDALVEYRDGGLCFYFFRPIATFAFIAILLALHVFGKMYKERLLILSVYFIVSTAFWTIFWGYYDSSFVFEPLFLKVQVMICAMFFVIGVFLSIKHIIYLQVINFCFMICCVYLFPEFPLLNMLFYAVIMKGSGYMAYISRSSVINFYKEKESNRRITLVNEELREMNQSKDDLFRIIGHDLRTPFYQLQNLIEMIDQTDSDEERTELKGLIKESAVKGNQLLEDLLEWSSIYKKQSDAILEIKEISEIVDKVFQFSDFKRKNKEISLINKLPQDLKIAINPAMMETVIRNLVANAIKFSHRGSKIIVKSHAIAKHVIIAVEDKGVGMTKEVIKKLFKGDKNTSTKGTENEAGTGFGLSIAKKLVEKQNGIFEIASTYNKGTTISMYFPLNQSA